jgi:prenyltransferase beta subunit
MLGRPHWLDAREALRFIDVCARTDGGLAHAPGEPSDPYCTFFGLAARALLADALGLDDRPVDRSGVECAFALPRSAVPDDCRLPPAWGGRAELRPL